MIAIGYIYNEDGELYDPTMGMDDDEREEYMARHPPLSGVPSIKMKWNMILLRVTMGRAKFLY